MKRFLRYLLPLLLCLAVGWISSLVQADSMAEWYPLLRKPVITPPGFVFAIAWTVLYICMGVACGLLLDSSRGDERPLLQLWSAQLAVNLLWSALFFAMRSPLAGVIDIVVLDVLVAVFIVRAWRRHRAASWLFVPYAAWLVLATYLNMWIWLNN